MLSFFKVLHELLSIADKVGIKEAYHFRYAFPEFGHVVNVQFMGAVVDAVPEGFTAVKDINILTLGTSLFADLFDGQPFDLKVYYDVEGVIFEASFEGSLA